MRRRPIRTPRNGDTMTKIPSNQSTHDFIFRIEVGKGYALRDTDNPHLLGIDGFFDPSRCSDEPIKSLGSFHSLDVTVLKNKKHSNEVELRTFHHQRHEMDCWFSLEFSDAGNTVSEHEYLITVILRYLVTTAPIPPPPSPPRNQQSSR
jgi:hypothetical protein